MKCSGSPSKGSNREPRAGRPALVQPLRGQRGLAEAWRCRHERDAVLEQPVQALEEPRALDEAGPRGRPRELRADEHALELVDRRRPHQYGQPRCPTVYPGRRGCGGPWRMACEGGAEREPAAPTCSRRGTGTGA